MPPSLLIELGVSLLGVGVLVGVSWLAGAWRSAIVTFEAAADRLAFDEPDFKTGEWMVGADGKSAVALSADGGEIALVFALGDSLATRRLKRAGAPVRRDGAAIVFTLKEPSRRAVRLAAEDERTADNWLSRIARVGL
ncbi:MAG: hypothetical protein U5J99_02535 [Parvularculaceae bacterium]|nr:hypothetical protein [Parvularculaceae bacterium]